VGAGWDAAVRDLEDGLPARHEVGLDGDPAPLPPALRAYVAGVHAGRNPTAALAFAEAAAAAQGIRMRQDVALVDGLRALTLQAAPGPIRDAR